jgi:NAD(P)H dehydrogenase (quinone)
MFKVIIVYDSKTGNVEKMARAVAEGALKVEDVEVEVKSVGETTFNDLLSSDGIILGSPTHLGLLSANMKQLLDSTVEIWPRLQGKVGAAFSSCGGLGGGAELTILSLLIAMLNHGMIVFGIPEYVSKKPPVTLHYGAVAIKEPDLNVLKACQLLGEKSAKLVKKVYMSK